jgi:hypothetical protein
MTRIHVRAPGRLHLVQHYHADGCLSLLRDKATRSQPRSDQRLVAAHRRFDQRASAIICCFLPASRLSLGYQASTNER